MTSCQSVKQTMLNNQNIQVVDLINFHGLTMIVVAFEGIEYIYAKPISDLAGVHWRKQKRTLMEEENAILYGSRVLKHPVLASGGGPRATPSESVYIRLDRARMFLARINTRQMKAQGNINAAEELLKLQIEWAEVLHKYETVGAVYKKAQSENLKDLMTLVRSRPNLLYQNERAVFTGMIQDKMAELGYPVEKIKESEQGELELEDK